MTPTKTKGPSSKASRRRAGESSHRVTVTDDDGQSGVGRDPHSSEAAERALRQLREKHGGLPGQSEPARPASPAQPRGRLASLSNDFGLTKKELAQTIGLAPEALYKSRRLSAAKTQSRLRDMAEILNRVSGWSGGKAQAMAWYRAEPIPAFGGRTAESLVKSGQAGPLRDYLDSIAMGGFA